MLCFHSWHRFYLSNFWLYGDLLQEFEDVYFGQNVMAIRSYLACYRENARAVHNTQVRLFSLYERTGIFFHILYSIQTRALEDEEWPDMFSCRLVFCFLVRKHDFTCHDVTSLEVVSWFSMLLYNLRSSIIHTSTKKRCQGNYISYYSN